jgi:hypothetical protein
MGGRGQQGIDDDIHQEGDKRAYELVHYFYLQCGEYEDRFQFSG